jgi:hypothetical protein
VDDGIKVDKINDLFIYLKYSFILSTFIILSMIYRATCTTGILNATVDVNTIPPLGYLRGS